MIPNLLDRHLIREWLKIFLITTFGFPLVVILFELTDKLNEYLPRGIEPQTIALAYLFSLPDKVFMVLPAAVLFATVFALGSMNRHSELVAAKASGRSFHRIVIPLFGLAILAAGAGLLVGELAPAATRRHVELLGEVESRNRTSRNNFVFRGDEGWVYTIRSLDVGRQRIQNVVLAREGSDEDYPTLVVQARSGTFAESPDHWTLSQGRFRLLSGVDEVAFGFDSLRMQSFRVTPAELASEAKRPQEMTYAELGNYIDALERSGGDGRRLTVEQALKFAVPFTCIVIAILSAPLAVAAPRTSGAFGVGIALGTTMVFLTTLQLSQTIGAAGVIPPTLAAWMPNIVFGVIGLWMLAKVRT
jgi:lipopolysaccharide export system permease protein